MANSSKASKAGQVEAADEKAEATTEAAQPDPETDAEQPESAVSDAASSGAEPAPEAPGTTIPEPEPPAPEAPAAAESPRRRGGFLGAVLGGVIAAAIGFGAAFLVGSDSGPFARGNTAEETRAALAERDTRITALDDRLQAQEAALSDLQGRDTGAEIDAALREAESRLTGRIDDFAGEMGSIAARLDALETRVTEIEKRPIADAAGDISGAVAAYESELEAMRNELGTQRERSEDLARQVAAAATQATAEIGQAAEHARSLEARAAVLRIMAALETGGGFASALDMLEGVQVPPVLAATASAGVPTLAQLQQAFADPARDAVAVSLRETAGGDAGNRLSAFLRTQFGARSLEPREGSDPDAILSRAEAALAAGDLRATLDEIATLPEGGREAMSGWVSMAQSRLDAVEAANALAASLNVN